MEDTPKPKPGSLLKRALFNQYNYIMVGSSALFSMATGSWLPAVIGAGAEVLWLVLGADTKAFRRWASKQDAKEATQHLHAEMSAILAGLDDQYGTRFAALLQMNQEIQQLAAENEGLETLLIQDEMAKLDQLLMSFLKMASSHQRLGQYLRENPISSVEEEIAHSQRALRREADPRVQASLKQAIALAQKRLGKHQQIDGAWKALSVQMDTLEKSFDYLKSHILGIGTREELAAALDDLVTGVASVSELESATAELTDDLRVAAGSRAAIVTKSYMFLRLLQIIVPAVVVFTTLFGLLARGDPKPGGVALFLRVGLVGLALAGVLYYAVHKTAVAGALGTWTGVADNVTLGLGVVGGALVVMAAFGVMLKRQ